MEPRENSGELQEGKSRLAMIVTLSLTNQSA